MRIDGAGSRLWLRGALAGATLVAGIRFVGVGYPHLCSAGSRTIEAVGTIGLPLAATAAVFFIHRYRVGLLVAACLLTADYAAGSPTHDGSTGRVRGRRAGKTTSRRIIIDMR